MKPHPFSFTVVALAATACLASPGMAQSDWRLVYANDAAGDAMAGSKTVLIDHVRSGRPVRVGWAGQTVEHVDDASFLTIFEGEVYAQVEAIPAQSPNAERDAIRFRGGDMEWQAMFSTTGTMESLATGSDPQAFPMAVRWYVLAPQS